MSGTEKSYEGLSNIIIKEQFNDSFPRQLSVFLKERPTENLKELAKVAQQYISGHQCQLGHIFSNRDTKKMNPDKGEVDKNMKCFNCNCPGHKAMDCDKPKKVRQKKIESIL